MAMLLRSSYKYALSLSTHGWAGAMDLRVASAPSMSPRNTAMSALAIMMLQAKRGEMRNEPRGTLA